MIENDAWLRNNIIEGRLGEVNINNVNPASVDVCLGEIHEVRFDGRSRTLEPDTDGGIVLAPDRAYICSTKELTMCPCTHAWMFTLKSSIGARRGVFLTHPGWGDPGFIGSITFTIAVRRDTKVFIGEKFAQLVYMRLREEPEESYELVGHYQHSAGIVKEGVLPC